MIFGISEDGYRINARNARRAGNYKCPICGQALILRAGVLKMAHFAHHANTQCEDNWNYDNSDFKRTWQSLFEDDEREKVITDKNGIKHLADIVNGKYAVEFQHDRLNMTEFDERNRFFTDNSQNVVWLFDLSEIYEDGDIVLNEDTGKGQWKKPLKTIYSLISGNKEYPENVSIYGQIYEKENSGKIQPVIIKFQSISFQNQIMDFEFGQILDVMGFIRNYESGEKIVVSKKETAAVKQKTENEKTVKGQTIMELWKMNYRVAIFSNVKTGVKAKIFDDQAEKALKSDDRKWMGFIKSQDFKAFTKKPMEVFGSEKKDWKVDWFVTHQDAKY